MFKKKMLAVLIVALLLGGTGLAFAYWDNLQQQQAEELNIGNGVTLQVSAVATAPVGKVLVPAGVVMKANDVSSIVLTYNVKLDEAALAALDLDVVASNIQIGGSTVNADLVNIDISLASATVNDANVLVTVTVTLDQPATVAIYNVIKNQAITFDLTFTASIA
ncbi:MAG: hypothetical protein WC509_00160 [Candidatus Izemoplasmatales bacterium]